MDRVVLEAENTRTGQVPVEKIGRYKRPMHQPYCVTDANQLRWQYGPTLEHCMAGSREDAVRVMSFLSF